MHNPNSAPCSCVLVCGKTVLLQALARSRTCTAMTVEVGGGECGEHGDSHVMSVVMPWVLYFNLQCS